MPCKLSVLSSLALLVLALLPLTAQAQSNNAPYPVITPWSDGALNRDREPEDYAKRYIHAQRRADTNTQANLRPRQQSDSWPRERQEDQTNRRALYQNRQQDWAAPDPSGQELQSPPSALEKAYSERIVDELEQFGYDLFGVPKEPTAQQLDNLSRQFHDKQENAPKRNTPMGAVQDDYVLQSGDEVEIMFTGQRKDRKIYTVNPRGNILIEDFPPIPAAGRTIGQVHFSVQAAASNLYNTQSYISLASVRQIGVLVIGHVKKPGRRNLTVFHSALDALMESGGVHKTGSLRNIKLVRNGRSTIIDLYNLLMYGGSNLDMTLRDGDRIIVPPLGPTVAVAGEVKRPGIYELSAPLAAMHHERGKHIEKLSLNDMLDLGGGVLLSGDNRYLKLDIKNNGEESVSEVSDPFAQQFGDGAILMVSKGKDKRSGTLELTGNTRKAGIHALSQNKTLQDLLHNETVLGPNIYPLIGVIERWDNDQLTTKMIGFPLRLVIKGKYNRQLQDGDIVHLFSNAQIAALQKDELEKAPPREMGSTPPREDEEISALAENVPLQSFLSERSAFIRGAVRSEGAYPVGEGTALDSIIAVAGGLTLEANAQNIEITTALNGQGHQTDGRTGTRRLTVNFNNTNPETVMIEPGDSVRVNTRFKKLEANSVLIMGEVVSPGRYDLLPGDKLSDLVERAGGLTQQAYPDGAIFSRASERKAEESRFEAAARDLERSIAVAIEKAEYEDKDGPDLQKIAMARDLTAELRNVEAVGRITVESDPAVLSVEPELDILLEKGDRLYIPKRPLTVRVTGEVLSPASLQFRQNKDPLQYIHEAGGFTFNADKERSFVLYPDGSAQPLQVSSWNHRATFIPPGSTIVVPRDPEPFNFVQSAKDISQILSNLAITGVFIDDIHDDD